MPDRPQPRDEHVRKRMEQQGRRDTMPELALRRELHARGLRYRVDRSPLPGIRWRADLVFGPAKLAVFVDGCFWHGCPQHCVAPKNNNEWWRAKLDANRIRDRRVERELEIAGWQWVRVWEHEDPSAAAEQIAQVVRARSPKTRTVAPSATSAERDEVGGD